MVLVTLILLCVYNIFILDKKENKKENKLEIISEDIIIENKENTQEEIDNLVNEEKGKKSFIEIQNKL